MTWFGSRFDEKSNNKTLVENWLQGEREKPKLNLKLIQNLNIMI